MSLLAHVLAPCADPDCEVHCIEVGLSEDTVTDADLAFFIAGAQAMSRMIQETFERRPGDPHSRLTTACLFADRRIRQLAEGRS